MPGQIPLTGEKFPEVEALTIHCRKKLPKDFED